MSGGLSIDVACQTVLQRVAVILSNFSSAPLKRRSNTPTSVAEATGRVNPVAYKSSLAQLIK